MGHSGLCRIVRRYDEGGQARQALFFSTLGLGRFDPPDGAAATYGSCYFAREPIAAYIERFGSYPVTLQDVIEARQLVDISPLRAVRLADVCNPVVLGQYGLTREICAVTDYDLPQRWAAALHQAGFDGVWYGPRHDPQGDLRAATLFGPPGGREPDQVGLRIVNRRPIPHAVIVRAAQDFGLYVVAADQP